MAADVPRVVWHGKGKLQLSYDGGRDRKECVREGYRRERETRRRQEDKSFISVWRGQARGRTYAENRPRGIGVRSGSTKWKMPSVKVVKD